MAETSWLTAVVSVRDESIPLVALQPGTDEQYEASRTRLARAGFSRMSRAEWARTAWPYSSTTAVDVAEGRLIRFTNGTTSFYCSEELELGPLWLAVAERRGRALVALLPVGWVDDRVDAETLPGRVAEAAAARRLWAATGVIRVDLVRRGEAVRAEARRRRGDTSGR